MTHYPSGRITGAYADALGITDVAGPIDRIAETISPVIDIWSQPEWALLRGEIPFARFSESPAVAGRVSSLQLTLPTTATVIVVVEFVEFLTAAIDVARDSGAAVGNVTATNRGTSLDLRFQPGEVSQLLINIADAAAGVVLPQWRSSSTARVGRPPRWILAPGDRLAIFRAGGVVNSAIDANLQWRERSFFTNEVRR